ncbi:MAG TPA: hypothetical protein VMO47_12675 [Rhodothermales bacterium]|nr:hypothetical protein [Rhodothermales bacterium]
MPAHPPARDDGLVMVSSASGLRMISVQVKVIVNVLVRGLFPLRSIARLAG